VLHGACVDGDGEPEHSEHVIVCKCSCHHQVFVPSSDAVALVAEAVPSRISVLVDDFIPDAEPSGIFRPPRHLA
jgi:hypothetical protein